MSGPAFRASSTPASRLIPALGILALAPFAVFANVTAVTAIEEQIGAHLHSSPSALTLIVNITSIATAPLILLSGHLGDRYGRKRIYLIGSLIFALASFLCAAAGSTGLLIVARGFQGIGAGILTALSLSLIATLLGPERRGLAIGAWSSGVGLGLAVGPLLGAALTGGAGWRWLFVVIGAATLVVWAGSLIATGEIKPVIDGRWSFDIAGTITSIAGVAAISVGATYASTWGWSSARTIVLLVSGVALFGLFALAERRAAVPLVRINAFSVPSYSVVAAITLINLVVVIGMFVFTGLSLAVNLGKSGVTDGLMFLPFSALLLLLSAAFGRLLDRVGPRPMLIGVEVAGAAGLFYLAAVVVTANPTYGALVPGLVLVGLSAAAGGPTTASTLVHGQPSTRIAEGASINGTLVQLGSAIGSGIVAGAFGANFAHHLVAQVSSLGLGPAKTGAALGALAHHQPPSGLSPAELGQVIGATHLAFGHTLQGVLIGLGVLSVIALVISFRVRLDEIRTAASVTHDALTEAAAAGVTGSGDAMPRPGLVG
ncbi:MAG TPA: MFS transporter [Solirubrobacteraceae bacterium]|nr:MFS transporter [Solirubrobacteraceae bacterium]